MTSTFKTLGLSAELLQAVADEGYEAPTPIQSAAIPVVQAGHDVIATAQTGTGKTAAFVLPILQRLQAHANTSFSPARHPVRALIITPTRELAVQVADSVKSYGRHLPLRSSVSFGGVPVEPQARELLAGVEILVATPGRLLDHLGSRTVNLSAVEVLVLDEADRMLDMGFIPDVERIVGLLPKARQTLFFSATMPPEIRGLADAFLKTPVEIAVAPPASPAATVVQSLAIVAPEDKREALRRLIASEDVKNALIFCNRKRDVDILQRSLSRHGLDAAALHGDMSQPKRTETLERFKNGEVRLLVASDVAARGLDIQGLSHVFNFDVPYHAEDYVHRIGRTGRAGREGRSFTLAAPEDGKNVAAIQKLIGKDIPLANVHGIADAELEFDEGARHRGGRRNAAAPRVNGKPAGGKRIGGERPERRAARPEPARETERPRHEPSSRREPPRRNGHDRPQAARGQDGHEAPVVGFGDDLPAFLRRAPRIAAEA